MSTVSLSARKGVKLLAVYLRGRLFDSRPDHVLARPYCGSSPTWELAKDPLLRLALFLVCQ
jgi:hypothetical protein